jgi:hypothetical protein
LTGRRLRLAAVALLVLAPLLWAAYRHARERDSEELLRAVATAHRRVSYEAEGAWGNEWPGTWITHDATTGRTQYRCGPWSHVHDGPNGRMCDPAAFCLDVDAFLGNYEVTEGGPTAHLGRDARTLLVASRHEGRPRLELVVDRATLLPLKVKAVRHDGTPLREAVFHSLALGPQEVRPRSGPGFPGFGRSVPRETLDESAGFPVWWPAYLPAGFRLVDCRVSQWRGPSARLLYTDGVTAFEVLERVILTPAQMETAIARRPGPMGMQREMRWYLQCARRALMRSAGAGPDGIATECHEWGAHRRYELRLDEREVTLVARADLDPEEHLRVLRSLVLR